MYLSFCSFSHPMIYLISDVTMSISTWDRKQFWIYLLNHNSYVIKLDQLIDVNKGINFQKSFEKSEGLQLSSRSFSIQQPAPFSQ